MHISVHNGRPIPTRDSDARLAPTLTSTERSFVQGILSRIPAICALTLPTTHSYERVEDGVWAGGTRATWGTDNREATVRLSGPQGAHHFEVRSVDATANPYLVLSAIIAAGMRGITDNVVLKSGDCGKGTFLMTDEEQKALGVHDAPRLPRTLDEARRNLVADGVLKKELGEEFIVAYMKVNKVSYLYCLPVGRPVDRVVPSSSRNACNSKMMRQQCINWSISTKHPSERRSATCLRYSNLTDLHTNLKVHRVFMTVSRAII